MMTAGEYWGVFSGANRKDENLPPVGMRVRLKMDPMRIC
jgi:hypothetical protein